MSKVFQQIEDVITDEDFLAWYHQKNNQQSQDWQNWLSKNEQQLPLVRDAINFLDSLSLKENVIARVETDEALAALHARMEQRTAKLVTMRKPIRWWMTAAAVIVLVTAGLVFWKMNAPQPILQAAYGQLSNNQLPDGSTLILNANSTAKLSKDWQDGKDREVWLEGEAFFKVAKTAKRSRFIVHTDQLDVIVTGTQFNVMTRDNKTSVLLTEGSVILRTRAGEEYAMKPGEFVELTGESLARKEAKEDNVLAWKENKLAFDNTTLQEVAKVISRHYGVSVRVADNSTASRSLTGIMPNNNLDDLLKAIEIALDIRIVKSDSVIVFSEE